jgi:hypothetical protein
MCITPLHFLCYFLFLFLFIFYFHFPFLHIPLSPFTVSIHTIHTSALHLLRTQHCPRATLLYHHPAAPSAPLLHDYPAAPGASAPPPPSNHMPRPGGSDSKVHIRAQGGCFSTPPFLGSLGSILFHPLAQLSACSFGWWLMAGAGLF